MNEYEEEGKQRARTFQDSLNEFFVEEGIGWQIVDGEIVTRGTEAFEAAVRQAGEALQAARRATAKDEIHEALADLSRRPEPDLTGAVQHAMAALECVALTPPAREGRAAGGGRMPMIGEPADANPAHVPAAAATPAAAAGARDRAGLHLGRRRRPRWQVRPQRTPPNLRRMSQPSLPSS